MRCIWLAVLNMSNPLFEQITNMGVVQGIVDMFSLFAGAYHAQCAQGLELM